MSSLPTIEGLGCQDNLLFINGQSVENLALRAGQTPYYVYSRSALTDTVMRLRTALPEGTQLYYSLKANPMPMLVNHLTGLVDGFDLASIAELRVALDVGMPANQCIFTGPAKTRNELAAAIATGVVVNLESAEQMRLTAELGKQLGVRPTVKLRLNPHFSPSREHMKNYEVTQFGVDRDEAVSILAEMATLDLAFKGFHVFWGSQYTDADVIAAAQKEAYIGAMSLADAAPVFPQTINVGGGLAAGFYEEDSPVDLTRLRANMHSWLNEVRTPSMPSADASSPTLVVELGRYLVAESGVYVCRVVDRKQINGTTFLVTDGGLHQHLAASGCFGQLQRRNYRVRVANRLQQPNEEKVTVVGRLCSSLDCIAENISVPRAEIGDLIAVFYSGAYGPSFSPTGFLSHPDPVELLV